MSLFSNQILELIILPTEQCNFRCKYCYEDFLGSKITESHVQSIKQLISKRASDLKQLRIGWFGGEPLLVKEIIFDISSHCTNLAKEYNLSYESGMSTNGYLLMIDDAKRLIENGITDYQITLDGPKQVHDKTRVKKNGTGTFIKIWENIINLKRSNLDFKINLRIHLSKDNINYIRDFIPTLTDTFNGDKRFRLFFKTIEQLKSQNTHKIKTFSEYERLKYTNELVCLVKKKNVQTLNPDSSYICYAGRPTSFVIRQDGTIAKCTVGLDDQINQIGKLRSNGKLEIIQERIRPWLIGALKGDKDFLKCPRRHIGEFKNLGLSLD